MAAPSPPPAATPQRAADPNRAFVPPPGWTPPAPTTQVAAAAPMPSAPPPPMAATPPPTSSAPSRGNQQVAVIQFGAGSAGLTGNDFAVLRKVAEIQKNNRATVRIVAHAQQDASGSSADQVARVNYEVSRQRALAVANLLVQLGVPANRIVAEAASDAEPAYETSSARGIAANRRAEIFVDF
jgi:outer membrane protein OmpA-like peptidoglycan-associated protein